jgi:hypothetical protein
MPHPRRSDLHQHVRQREERYRDQRDADPLGGGVRLEVGQRGHGQKRLWKRR